MAIDDIYQVRLDKLNRLKEAGFVVYPADTTRTISFGELQKVVSSSGLPAQKETMVGRVMAKRGQGAIVFFDLFDGTGKFQAVLQADVIGEEAHELFIETVDIGDFVEVTGGFFETKQGQPSTQVEKWRMLSKSLRPLPDKWHGLQDPDLRYRNRHIDILLNDELREMFRRKAKFIQAIRQFLIERGFMEVDTPTLELTTGGAEARPFQTHHNDLDLDVYLRISIGELWQKRLMTAGFEKTFEVGRVYRNEGSSPEHLQEFTNIEFYGAYINFEDGKDLVKELYRHIAKEVYGKTEFTKGEYTFDFADPWKELDYVDTVKEITGIDVLNASEDDMKAKLTELGVEYDGENRERLMDTLWKYCRRQISGPAFLTGHPKLVAPLSKTDEANPDKTKTFQVILAGSEVGRAHAELNDPLEQRKRFEQQAKLLEEGDEEAMMPDWDYVEAMEYGMPPVFGFGFGERLFAYFENKPIRETQLFPLMRPKGEE